MRRSIATVCLSGTLEEKLVAAAAAGFDGVEVFENDLIGSPLRPAEVRERASELGLSIDLFQPFRDLEAVAPEIFARNLRRAEAKLELMEALGATTMLVCSNVSPDAVDDDELAAAQLRELARRAGERGLRIAYEALAWGRHVSEYDHAWRIVEAADHPELGVCLDSFHVLSRGTGLDAIGDIPADKLFYLQLADAPYLVMDVLQWSRHYRCFPGQGGFDLPGFTARVLDAGYDGPLSLEVFNDVFRQADPERMAVDAMRSLLILEESLDHPAAARLPAPAPLRGWAFVELAVDAAASADTERLLHALGFELAGVHRSKPVTLWRQGDIRVLLNVGARAAGEEDDRPPGPGVVAIAVESADPDASAERAEALLAPVLSRRRGPGEADLAAIAAPDGSSVFFCRTDAGDDLSWTADFEPRPAAPAPSPPLLRAIDHVALSHPFDFFDEAALFYRSVLGLRPRDSQELAAPDGLIRSRDVVDGERNVRLALNVPVTGAGDVGGLQHIAFACDDVFAAARAMRDRGVDPLEIPANYHDDLAARIDVEPGLLDAMREHGVLLDRTPDGDFLHFYTPIVGSRLFLEVVQRRAAYDGYGAANAPVRMAAQRAPARVRATA